MVFITGANGLVGSFAARRLLQAGMRVVALKRSNSNLSLVSDIADQIEWCEGDILDVMSLQKAMQGADYVLHTAAIVSFAPADREKMNKVNVEGTANVVNACLEANIKKLCFVSSVAALGRPINALDKVSSEIIETTQWQESPLNSHYAKTKYLAELEVWRGVAEGLDAVVVNPSLILGEADWTKTSTQIFKFVYDGKPFFPVGTVNYVDVLDVAEIIYLLLNSPISGEKFILNAGRITYQEFFKVVAQYLGKRPPRYRITSGVANVLWRIEAIRSFFTKKAPLITKETALSSSHDFCYPNHKVRNTLNYSFKNLDESLERICTNILKKTTQKSN